MNAQEVFDITANHLLTMRMPATDRDLGCSYLTIDGRKCAVGIHFTAAEYTSDMENQQVSRLHASNLLPERLIPHVDLLELLQDIHDSVDHQDCFNIPLLREQLRDVASKHNLIFNTEILTC